MTKDTHLDWRPQVQSCDRICDGYGIPKKQYDDAAKKPRCSTSDSEKREPFPIDDE
jgi:hypothetical protein